jgi:hypothetical protein
MEGYSVTEAASVLGVPTERVWELLARGILSGAPDGETGMRVFLQPRPAPLPPAVDERFQGSERQAREPEVEASPFRELLTEFRNLTERYGQALLALGESRGEVASLRSRVDLLEARFDLRLPMQPPMQAAVAAAAWGSSPPSGQPAAEVSDMPPDLQRGVEAPPDEHPTRRRRGRGHRATDEFAQALARAEDPSPAELPGAVEAAAAFAALRDELATEAVPDRADDAALPRELPAAEAFVGDLESEPFPEFELPPEPEPIVPPEPGLVREPESVMSQAETEHEPIAAPEPGLVVEPEAVAIEPEPEAEPATVEPESEPAAEPESRASEPVPDAETQPEPIAFESFAEPEPATVEPEPEPEPATVEPHPGAEWEPAAELEPVASEPVPEAEPQPVAVEPEPEPEPTIFESEPMAEPESTVVEPELETQTDADSGSVAMEAEPFVEPESVAVEPEPVAEPESVALEPEPEPDVELPSVEAVEPATPAPAPEPQAAGAPDAFGEPAWDRDRYSASIEEPDWFPEERDASDRRSTVEPGQPADVMRAEPEAGGMVPEPDVSSNVPSEERADEEKLAWASRGPEREQPPWPSADDPAAEMEVASMGSHLPRPASAPQDTPAAAPAPVTMSSAPQSPWIPSAPAARPITPASPASRAYRRLRRIFPG